MLRSVFNRSVRVFAGSGDSQLAVPLGMSFQSTVKKSVRESIVKTSTLTDGDAEHAWS